MDKNGNGADKPVGFKCPSCKNGMVKIGEPRLLFEMLPSVHVCPECGTCFVPKEIQSAIRDECERRIVMPTIEG